MKTVAKRNEKKELKREKILEAASYLFSNHNYHEVMMDDVARKLSIAKGTLYLYFSSKEELYFTIIETRLAKLVESLKEKINSEYSVVDSIKTFVVHTYMFMMKYKNFFLMYEKEKLNADNHVCSKIKNLEEARLNILITIINKGKSQGIFNEIESGLAAEMAVNVIYAAIKRGIEKEISDENKISEREAIFEFIINGLLVSDSSLDSKLKSLTVLIARNLEKEFETKELFSKYFKSVFFFPSIAVNRVSDYSEFDLIIKSRKFDYIIFTSANAVEYFSKRLSELGLNIDFTDCLTIAVGSKTEKACEAFKIPVSKVPEKFSASGVLELLNLHDVSNKNILIPCSEISRDEISEGLIGKGGNVFSIPVYTNGVPDEKVLSTYKNDFELNEIDWLVFTSPSTYINFMKIFDINNPQNYFSKNKIAVIGPTTAEAVEKSGVNPAVIPEEFTLEGIIRGIKNYYNRN